MDDVPRCAACGEVIGVYERLVRVVDGQARLTSRAAETSPCSGGALCYHRACYPHPVIDSRG